MHSTSDALESTVSFSPPYKVSLLPPPGATILAPHGCPASPFPCSAPPAFLDAMKIRVQVFCQEQGCSIENELDEDDGRSWSWVVYERNSENVWIPVSTIRLVPPPHPTVHLNGFVDEKEESYVKLGRVATVKEARGKGLSRLVIGEMERWLAVDGRKVLAGERWNGLILTHAQVDVEGLYRRLGYVTDPRMGTWLEEGIEHVGMWKSVAREEGWQ